MFYDATWVQVAGRLLIVAYFLVSLPHGVLHGRASHHITKLRDFYVPFPTFTFWAGWLIELTGCVLLLANWHVDIGIYCLMLFTVVSNLLYNRYWNTEDPVIRHFARMRFFANNAVLGGLLLLLPSI
jgi:uncharacterized membrane protein YphA (DoxX/SURF4 family)